MFLRGLGWALKSACRLEKESQERKREREKRKGDKEKRKRRERKGEKKETRVRYGQSFLLLFFSDCCSGKSRLAG